MQLSFFKLATAYFSVFGGASQALANPLMDVLSIVRLLVTILEMLWSYSYNFIEDAHREQLSRDGFQQRVR
jgi:hypothetical protein